MKSDNILFKNARGAFGEFVVRQVNGKTIISAKARPSKIKRKGCDRFKAATAYAKLQMQSPIKELYKSGVNGKKTSPYLVAVSDFLNAPVIVAVDISQYMGKPGDLITVIATDDFRIKAVSISILTDEGNIVEDGVAVPADDDPDLYVYECTKRNERFSHSGIAVHVEDFAGNATMDCLGV